MSDKPGWKKVPTRDKNGNFTGYYLYMPIEMEHSALNVSYFSIFVFGVLNVIIYMMTTRSGGQTLQCGD